MNELELGRHSSYEMIYNPSKLFAIPRVDKRLELGIEEQHELPFYGEDSWTHYEVSWLNPKGKPMVAIATIAYSCHSPYIIESKSMKLYFNSFNHTAVSSIAKLEQLIKKDIEQKIMHHVDVKLYPLDQALHFQQAIQAQGICIDDLDIDCTEYQVNPEYLVTNHHDIEETLHSHLLKSNCLVTLQPDWGSVEICYQGKQIEKEGLLRYIVSFRNHNEFHEQCIERIFIDIMRQCQPKSLSVYGRYTRRGGLDINPFRTTDKHYRKHQEGRLLRQ